MARFECERGDACVGDAARDDGVECAHVGVHVQCEPVQGDSACNPDADLAEFAFARVVADPHSRPAVDASGRDAEPRTDRDERRLDASYVIDDVERLGESDDRVAHELAGTMPGDASTTVDVDDVRAVGRKVGRLGALARRVCGGVFEEQEEIVIERAVGALGSEGVLGVVGVLIVDDAEGAYLERGLRIGTDGFAWHGDPYRFAWASPESMSGWVKVKSLSVSTPGATR
ncbi:Uncharacterised protein [Mycobacteroides abscessus subsp. abscessus]|nr:Uncharacterised protein [Mycobacteroides abscessus subsp. abscessus]